MASNAKPQPPADVDAYIAALASELRPRAAEVRAAIRTALPDAEETISYGMPTFRLGRKAVLHFAVWKKHVGLYPVSPGPPGFEAAIGPYRAAKDTAQFVHADPLPVDLIARIVLAQKARHDSQA